MKNNEKKFGGCIDFEGHGLGVMGSWEL